MGHGASEVPNTGELSGEEEPKVETNNNESLFSITLLVLEMWWYLTLRLFMSNQWGSCLKYGKVKILTFYVF